MNTRFALMSKVNAPTIAFINYYLKMLMTVGTTTKHIKGYDYGCF